MASREGHGKVINEFAYLGLKAMSMSLSDCTSVGQVERVEGLGLKPFRLPMR